MNNQRVTFINMKNFPLLDENGKEWWISRSIAVTGCVFTFLNGKWCVLVNKRGEGTQDKRYNDWIKEHPQRIAWNACNIDPRAVERLNRLTDATGAKIVISSTWRSDSNLQEVFNLVGIKEPIHDITPYMRSRHRGSEIQEWLDKQTEPYRYVIFDDDTDMLDSQLPYFIQSDWLKWGLSDEDVEQAIHILNDTNTTTETHL